MASKAVSLPFAEKPSSSFGGRWLDLDGKGGNPAFWNVHTGTDWAKWYGTPLRAVGRGRVSQIVYTALKGWQIEVTVNIREKYRYHLVRARPDLQVGDLVEWGDIIALSGPHLNWQNTGAAASGPHVHFEYWVDGKPADPRANLIFRTEAPSSVINKPIENTPSLEQLTPTTKDEDDMNSGISFPRKDSTGRPVTVYAILNTDSGFYSEWSGTSASYNTNLQKAFRLEGGYAPVTEGHRNNLKASCDLTRARK